MKEYFYEKDNKAIIIDDKKGIIIEDAKDNTEEILITENNIEQIEAVLNDANEKKLVQSYFLRTASKGGKIFTVLMSIALLGVIGIASTYLAFNEMLPMILLSVFTIGFCNIAMFNNKDIKHRVMCYDMYIKELEKELEKENTKYKTLKSKSKDKIVESTMIKEIPKNEMIDNLKRKKELISDYIKNNKKYVSAYNNNEIYAMLRKKDYSESDIEFIKFLIEEDLKNTNTNEKGKTKKYTNN